MSDDQYEAGYLRAIKDIQQKMRFDATVRNKALLDWQNNPKPREESLPTWRRRGYELEAQHQYIECMIRQLEDMKQ